jgi:predicted TIM-barrel fold metal-dependent hydrolase
MHTMDTRRDFLRALGIIGAGALVGDVPVSVLGAGRAAGRIDVHHHVSPPKWIAELASKNLATGDITGWSVAKSLDDMDKAGVATSIVSVTTPGVSFTDAAAARRVARESNEWVAQLRRDHPGRFGSFAMLPMQDVDGSLREIEYSLDTLKADGIGLLTSYGDKWLGHPTYAPIMNELNRRKAILYTHPTLANCCRGLLPDVAPTVVEFGTDTSRTITDIVFSGTAARCPDLRFIFSHAGGTLPFLTERLIQAPVINKNLESRVPNGVLHELKRFYYDTAWAYHPAPLAALTKLVDLSQVVYGSDYPYRTGAETIKGLMAYGFSARDLAAIGRGNAVRLMPRLNDALQERP